MLSSVQLQPLIDLIFRFSNGSPSVTPWQVGGVAAGTVVLVPVFKLARFLLQRYRSPLKDLRGPETVDSWFWGHLATVLANPSDTFEGWIEKYGPTIQHRGFFQNHRLLTIDPRAIAYIVNHSYDFPKPTRFREDFARVIGHGVFAAEGEAHRRQRRMMNPCFGSTQIRGLMPIFYDKAYLLRSVWNDAIETKGPVIDVLVGMARTTLDIIGTAGFSYEFDSLLVGETNELIQSFMDVFAPANSPTALDFLQRYLPLLKLIPTQRGKAIKNSQEVVGRICAKILEDKKAAVLTEQGGIDKEKLAGRDILSILVRANLDIDVKESERMTDQEVMDQIKTILFAGHETSSTSLTWLLYEISKPENIRIQHKLKDELLAVDNERPSMDELNSLPYLDAVIRETLRLDAVVEYVTRAAEKDDVIPVAEPFVDRYGVLRNEIRIAKGEVIAIPILTLNRHPKIWGEDGAEFKPERWLTPDKRINELPSVFSGLMTFSGGPRGCIGYRLVLMEMKVLIFVLLRHFAFDFSDPTLVFEKKAGLVSRPALRQPDGTYKNTLLLRLSPLS
ncbi:hypothetical protein FRB99_005758 [Tulasnella sp. 403]|nr:hypothetical protein FRB99_005758 [Tulasnella sp. 403]